MHVYRTESASLLVKKNIAAVLCPLCNKWGLGVASLDMATE